MVTTINNLNLIVQSRAATKNQGAAWNSTAFCQNTAVSNSAYTDGKILATRENQADGKILAGVKISAPGEIPESVEILAELEKQAARLMFRLGGISNCLLLPGPADEQVLLLVDVLNLEHLVSK